MSHFVKMIALVHPFFSKNVVWNLRLCYFWRQRTTKKTLCTTKKLLLLSRSILKNWCTSHLFFRQKLKNDCVAAGKFDFVQIVSLVHWVFPEFFLKSHLCSFVDTKKAKKDYADGKNITFCRNSRSGTRGFPEILSNFSPFHFLNKNS